MKISAPRSSTRIRQRNATIMTTPKSVLGERTTTRRSVRLAKPRNERCPHCNCFMRKGRSISMHMNSQHSELRSEAKGLKQITNSTRNIVKKITKKLLRKAKPGLPAQKDTPSKNTNVASTPRKRGRPKKSQPSDEQVLDFVTVSQMETPASGKHGSKRPRKTRKKMDKAVSEAMETELLDALFTKIDVEGVCAMVASQVDKLRRKDSGEKVQKKKEKKQKSVSESNEIKSDHQQLESIQSTGEDLEHIDGRAGNYPCHLSECDWRGLSYRDRSRHMKQNHLDFINPRNHKIFCFECSKTFVTNQQHMRHMLNEHRVGGQVEQEFSNLLEFEKWFDGISRGFSIEFVKSKKETFTSDLKKIYSLYCKHGENSIKALYGELLENNCRSRPEIAQTMKPKVPLCACCLQVTRHGDGRIGVSGCVYHTDHRFGTSLLRPSELERKAMDYYFYQLGEHRSLLGALEHLIDLEGSNWLMSFDESKNLHQDLVTSTQENVSLELLIKNLETGDKDSFFGLVIPKDDDALLAIGFMNPYMQELWKNFAYKCVYFEEVQKSFGGWDLHITCVLILDDDERPQVAAIYISSSEEKNSLFAQLTKIWVGNVGAFVTNGAKETYNQIQDHFGQFHEGELNMQVAEWTLLTRWSKLIEEMMTNLADKFMLICALRRLLRQTNRLVFEQTLHELLVALKEIQQDQVAQYLRQQLSFTESKNPLFEYTCRFLRDKLVPTDTCSSIEGLIELLIRKVAAYSESQLSLTDTIMLERPRSLPYIYLASSSQKLPEVETNDESVINLVDLCDGSNVTPDMLELQTKKINLSPFMVDAEDDINVIDTVLIDNETIQNMVDSGTGSEFFDALEDLSDASRNTL